jgi:hypothetical protein
MAIGYRANRGEESEMHFPSLRKTRKFLRSPGLFFRDYFVKRYPHARNEVGVTDSQTKVIVEHDLAMARRHAPKFDIDVVFTWVDDTDSMWRTRRDRWVERTSPDRLANDAADDARFTNNDELRYSLHAVRTLMPWVRRIYIVTDRQRPSWLSADEQVRIVDHSEIVERQYLPTFNSHVIEAFLHRIPGLSQHFVYFNDDVFVGRSLPPGHFYQANGIASLFASCKSLARMRGRGAPTATLLASSRSAELLKNTFGVEVDTPLVHTYVPLRKDTYEIVWKRYRAEIEAFLNNRFRGINDLNLATFLVPWTAFFEGSAAIARDICFYFNVRSPSAKASFRVLLEQQWSDAAPHSFCANDHRSATQVPWEWSMELRKSLGQYYGI